MHRPGTPHTEYQYINATDDEKKDAHQKGYKEGHAAALKEWRDSSPDPKVFKIIKKESIGKYLLLFVHYPNCKNFEGNKILVYCNVSPLDLLEQGELDPHFSDKEKYIAPIARFVPTDSGWQMAQRFVQAEDNASRPQAK